MFSILYCVLENKKIVLEKQKIVLEKQKIVRRFFFVLSLKFYWSFTMHWATNIFKFELTYNCVSLFTSLFFQIKISECSWMKGAGWPQKRRIIDSVTHLVFYTYIRGSCPSGAVVLRRSKLKRNRNTSATGHRSLVGEEKQSKWKSYWLERWFRL